MQMDRTNSCTTASLPSLPRPQSAQAEASSTGNPVGASPIMAWAVRVPGIPDHQAAPSGGHGSWDRWELSPILLLWY